MDLYCFGQLPTTKFKWYGANLCKDGNIYCTPFNSSSVLKINPENDSLEEFGNLPGSNKWIGGVLSPEGEIFLFSQLLPRDSNYKSLREKT